MTAGEFSFSKNIEVAANIKHNKSPVRGMLVQPVYTLNVECTWCSDSRYVKQLVMKTSEYAITKRPIFVHPVLFSTHSLNSSAGFVS